jgi:hypothetical protein
MKDPCPVHGYPPSLGSWHRCKVCQEKVPRADAIDGFAKKSEQGGDRVGGGGGCSDCGGKVNAAQVKASPAAMEELLRDG